jgi:hypothetical protein
MYSLVNVATLVRDLARSPRAASVATELLRVLALDATSLASLDASAYDEKVQARRRAGVLEQDRTAPRALAVLAAARGFADDLGVGAYSAALDVLERAPMGGVDDLQRLVRHDLLAAAWDNAGDVAVARYPRALDVVADGVLAAYVGDGALAQPWRVWVRRHGAQPAPPAWPGVVDRVRAIAPGAQLPPAPAAWASLVHDACWAVCLTGRERAAAVTQLHALLALTEVFGPGPLPLRAVSLTTAAVFGEVVADVLDADTRAALSDGLLRLVP